jgi:hypothetical protein
MAILTSIRCIRQKYRGIDFLIGPIIIIIVAISHLGCAGNLNRHANLEASVIPVISEQNPIINCLDSLVIGLTKTYNQGDTTTFWAILDTINLYCSKPEICYTDTFYPGMPYFQFKVNGANQLVTIMVMDIKMRLMTFCLNTKMGVGNYRINFSCTDVYGKPFTPGLYFIYLRIGKEVLLRRFLC